VWGIAGQQVKPGVIGSVAPGPQLRPIAVALPNNNIFVMWERDASNGQGSLINLEAVLIEPKVPAMTLSSTVLSFGNISLWASATTTLIASVLVGNTGNGVLNCIFVLDSPVSLFSNLIQAPVGVSPVSPAQQAQFIFNFTASRGSLARGFYSAQFLLVSNSGLPALLNASGTVTNSPPEVPSNPVCFFFISNGR
jgi:hypothetical protein